MKRSSLVELLDLLYAHGGGKALVERRGLRTVRWSYRHVADTASQFARELEAREIGPGDRVVLWGPNSVEWVAAFWGCLLRGAVAVPMDHIAAPDFAARVAQQVDARLVLTTRERVGLDTSRPALALEDLEAHVARYPTRRYRPPQLSRSDTTEIIFTSGTTAEPRGVVLTHGNLLANLEPLETEIAKYRKWERWFHPLRFLNLLPLSHVFGQFLGVFIPPLLGATVVFQESLNPAEVLRTIKRERVSLVVTVPRLLESLRAKLERDLEAEGRAAWLAEQMRAAEGEKFVRRMWRFRRIHRRFGWKFWAFLSGGAALPAQTEEFWMRLGFAVIQGYGLTETTSLVSVNHPFQLGKGSIGKVLPGREVKLDPSGEILVRGESVASGYWEGAEMKKAEGEWLRTGDLGEIGADGSLYFKGRKKNVIVTPEGLNIYPEDLEAALHRQPEVRDCVVVPLERDGNAEPCAVLLLCDPSADAAAVVARANQSLAGFQHMRRWVVWPDEDFPRTSTQKPRTNLIAEAAAAHFGHPEGRLGRPEGSLHPSSSTGAGSLTDLIARVTGRALAATSPNAQLSADLGLSSIERVELLSALEDRFQVSLDESRFAAAATLGELEQMLREATAAPTVGEAMHPTVRGEGPGRVVRQRAYSYPRWAARWPVTWIRFVVFYTLIWPAVMLLAHPRIRRRGWLTRARGPVLVIANHTTRSDVAFIAAALPPRLRHRLAFAMEAERLHPMRYPPRDLPAVTRLLLRLQYWGITAFFHVFPLPRQSGFRESFAYAGELVDRGYSVVVFPEGEYTIDGSIQPFQAGIGILANKLGIPIVPIRIEGLFELKQKRQRYARPGFVRVTVGKPVQFPPGTDPAQIAHKIEMQVKSLTSDC